MDRLPSTCAALRRARTAALDLAAEADTDGRHGIARALRRKVHDPRPGDWVIVQTARRVVAHISAYEVVATGLRYSTASTPAPDEMQLVNAAAIRIVSRERVAL